MSEQEKGKHTPGPWSLCGLDEVDQGPDVVGPDGAFIAGVGSSLEDARLIAAAPDLLESLLYLLEHPTTADADSDEAMRCVFARKKARIAIAKARGTP